MKPSVRSLLLLLALGLLTSLTACKKKKNDTAAGSEAEAVAARVEVEEGGIADPVASPDAVPGGTYTAWAGAFPQSLNMYLDYNSFSKQVMSLQFEGLVGMHSLDQKPVGILAESWEISEDSATFTFKLHPDAQWSDGKPIKAEDVQFFYDVIMNPKNQTSLFRVGLDRFERPVVQDERTLSITAKTRHWMNFWEAAGLGAFPKHAWGDKEFNEIHFDFPVVSGPYRLGEVKQNRSLELVRRDDWWGWKKRYNQNKYNFQKIRYKFMEDRTKALEAFKKGDFDLYKVYTAAIWEKQTDFEAVQKGWTVKQLIYNKEPKGFQGYGMNLRRPIFEDRRVREALSHLVNRELMNEKLMFNQYFLLNSYYPDLWPDNVNPNTPMRNYDPDKARALLKEVGWTVGADGKLRKDGQLFEITFLDHSSDKRHINIYLEDLKSVGIVPKVEQLSYSSLSKRLDQHDFDIVQMAWGATRLRDPEASWYSKTADEVATNNITGVKDTVIDSLIDAQKMEFDGEKRDGILKELDTRLNDIVPYVLLWQSDNHRLLFWNKFGKPANPFGKYEDEEAVITYWWIDPDKQASLDEAMKAGQSLEKPPFEVQYQGQ